MAENRYVRARTSIRNSLFARRNFSHCKQTKSGLKRRDFSTEEKKRSSAVGRFRTLEALSRSSF